MAAYARMRSAVAGVNSVHMITYSPDGKTGVWQRGDTWVAHGCLRREGLRGMRGLRGVNGRADYDSTTGRYTFSWDPKLGKYVMRGTDTNHPPSGSQEDVPRYAGQFTVEAYLEWTAASDTEVKTGAGLWGGRDLPTITVESPAAQRRAVFYLESKTNLPLHAVFSRPLKGRWEAYERVDYEFNLPLPEEMFTIESLERPYAQGNPNP
jgi:hypothetical protein